MTTEQKLDTLLKDVEKIKGYLENDASTNTQGLVESHRDAKRRLYALEQREKVRNAKQSVWAIVGGFLGGIALWLIKAIIGKEI